MALSDYLRADRVLFLQGSNRKEILAQMIDHADGLGLLSDRRAFERAIRDRESIVSTGIGLGVAVPHAKLHGMDDFFVIVGVLKDEVDWDSIDKRGVRLVFMIGGPDDRQTTYLQILAKIVLVTKNEKIRREILNAAQADDVISPFSGL